MCSSGGEQRSAIRVNDDATTGQPLGDVVVGVTLETQGDARGHERPEALAGRAAEVDVDRAVGQSGTAVAPSDGVAEHRPDGAVDVADRQLQANRLASLDGGLARREQLLIERFVQAVLLGNRLVHRLRIRVLRHGKDRD